MNLFLADEHTVDVDLLTGGWVIDVGCRNWRFSSALAELGEKVLGVDPMPDVEAPTGFGYVRAALEHGLPGGQVILRVCDNGNGTHVVAAGAEGPDLIQAPVITLPELLSLVDGPIDIFKIDAEGAEFALLANWPGPVATQLTVEMHAFGSRCPADPDKAMRKIEDHLGQWYLPVKHEKFVQWGRSNWWDSLWVLRPEY